MVKHGNDIFVYFVEINLQLAFSLKITSFTTIFVS